MKKYLNVYMLLAIVILLMTSCSGIGYKIGGEDCSSQSPLLGMFIMVDGDDGFTHFTTFSIFLIAVWIFALLSAFFTFLGVCDDTVGGHHIIWVDGKMHHIVNSDEVTVLSGTGSIERGNRWGNNVLSILIYVILFILLCMWFSELFDDFSALWVLLILVLYLWFVANIHSKILPLISLIKKGVWYIVALDFALGIIYFLDSIKF